LFQLASLTVNNNNLRVSDATLPKPSAFNFHEEDIEMCQTC